MTKVLKNTFKIASLVIVGVLLMLIFTACGENATFQGTWNIVSTTEGDTTKDRDTLTSELTDTSKTLDEQFNLVIKDDNTFELLTPASTTAQTGTWLKDDNADVETYKLTTLDNNVYTVTYQDKELIKVQIDDNTYYIMNKA